MMNLNGVLLTSRTGHPVSSRGSGEMGSAEIIQKQMGRRENRKQRTRGQVEAAQGEDRLDWRADLGQDQGKPHRGNSGRSDWTRETKICGKVS